LRSKMLFPSAALAERENSRRKGIPSRILLY
jgi:hypothetical protein